MCNQKFDIVFVTPSYYPLLSQESIGSLILAKKAQIANYSVKVIRFWEITRNNYETFRINMCETILNHNPKIVSFYCRGAEYHIMVDLANLIKNANPQTYIVFGGPQAELVAEDTLKHFPFVDFICCGEGENTIVTLLDFIIKYDLDEKMIKSIPGLFYRDNAHRICKNILPDLLPDDYSRPFNYYDLIPQEILIKSGTVTIDAGRGCPFACSFCSTKTFWKRKFRLRNTNDILKEIDYVTKNYGNKVFSFSHDHYTVNKSRVIGFCEALKTKGYEIKWTCSSRIDSLDYDLINLMVSAGLVAIYFGIETGSPRIQKIINKNLNIEQCLDIVRYSINKGLTVTTSFIYGFPQESVDDLEKTLNIVHMMLSMGADVQLHYLAFEKGSELYDQYHDKLYYSKENNKSIFGFEELFELIESYPDVFSNYWEYPSEIRNNMKYLHVLHSIGRQYPKIYVSILDCLKNKGLSYVQIYQLLFDLIKDTLIRFEKAKVEMSKSRCLFLLEKIISKLTNNSFGESLRIAECDKTQLKRILLQYN